MGLFRKIFSGDKAAPSDTDASTQFQNSDNSTNSTVESRNALRRELVHVVLRDTMRQHGVPSDWIDCRILSDAGSTRPALHVQLIVNHGHDRMLTYVPAFQASFMQGVTKFDPHASEWLRSLAWQFDGLDSYGKFPPMPDPASWGGDGAAAAGKAVAPNLVNVPAAEVPEDDDVSQDIRALFAIRDAAFKDEPPHGHVDFQETQPGR